MSISRKVKRHPRAVLDLLVLQLLQFKLEFDLTKAHTPFNPQGLADPFLALRQKVGFSIKKNVSLWQDKHSLCIKSRMPKHSTHVKWDRSFASFIQKGLFIFILHKGVLLPVCIYMHCVHAWWLRKPEEGSGSLKLELQMFGSPHMGIGN